MLSVDSLSAIQQTKCVTYEYPLQSVIGPQQDGTTDEPTVRESMSEASVGSPLRKFVCKVYSTTDRQIMDITGVYPRLQYLAHVVVSVVDRPIMRC